MKYMTLLALIILSITLCNAQEVNTTVDIPDEIKIGALENIFYPVNFAHKLHADMMTMGNNCATCHHNAEEGVYQACSACHLSDEKEASLEMPTLNGAYHRNCLNCHQDWTGDDVCETCHIKRKFSFRPRKALDATDILAHKHEQIIIPELFQFNTPGRQEKQVTFHHQEHVKLYRYDCTDCHRKADCSKCHRYSPENGNQTATLQIHHDPCSNCHETKNEEGCRVCHTDSPPKGFSHAITGWPLKDFHQVLSCDKCHTGSEPVAALDPTCTACHDNFEMDEFDHVVTGLQLNEDHIEIDCYECHTDNKYDVVPSCVECHDDDVSFPGDLPGMLIKRN